MSLIILNVDEVRRTLSASGGAFVVHDKEVDIVRFAINSGFADIVLDGQVALRVMYQRPGETQVRAQTLTYYDTDGLHNYYDWQLSQSDLAKNGSLMVALCILDISGGEVSEWHTTPCAVRVLSTIHTDDSDEGDDTITPTVKERVAVLESMIQRVASGAPIVVASTSAMTDTNQIYVLSTDRKWYYHNGTTWVSGGTYGAVATDTTLTQSGVPADAKAVGDALNNIESSLSDIKNICYEDQITGVASSLQWEQGAIKASDGTRGGDSKRIRTWSTYIIVPSGYSLKTDVPEGFKIQGYLYELNDSRTFRDTIYKGAMRTGVSLYHVEKTALVRFMLAKEDHTQNITVSELPEDLTISIMLPSNLKEDVSIINKHLSDEEIGFDKILSWEQGTIHTDTGSEMPISNNWTKRLYTPAYYEVSPYYDALLSIYVPATHKLQIYEYRHDETYVRVLFSPKMRTGNLRVNIIKGYKYRFVLAFADHEQEISVTDYPETMTMLLKSIGGRITDLYAEEANKRVYNLPIPSDFWSSPVISTYPTDFPTPSSASFTSAMYHEKLQALFNVAGRNTVSGYTELGQDSVGNSLYKYVLNYPPMHYASSEMAYISEDSLEQRKPKILMITGIHGTERPSSLGFYYFVKNIFESTDPVYEFIRNHVNLVAVPLMCPSGWNGVTYNNVNDRNLNRDFPGTDEGEAWSEIESNLLKGVIEDNLDMDFFLDWHNCLYRTEYPACISYGLTDDPDMYNPYLRVIQTIGNRWQKAYPAIDQTLGTLWGHNAHPNKGTVGLWLNNDYGIKTLLFESGMRHQVLGGYSNTSYSSQRTNNGDEYCVRQGVEIATNLIVALIRMISI